MRELKFRQRIKGTESAPDWWRPWGYVRRLYGEDCFVGPMLPTEFDARPSFQYTGLKDKGSKEGYHKDILNNGFDSNWLIEWDGNQGNFYLKSLLGYDPLPLRKIKGMVLIGNIIDNPELVKT